VRSPRGEVSARRSFAGRGQALREGERAAGQATNVHDVSIGAIPPGRSWPCGPKPAWGRNPPHGIPSLIALVAQSDGLRAETAYAASAFFAGEAAGFSVFFDPESDDDVEDSVFDSFFSPPSFDRSISRLRRFVP
jgi:hypothetical protein